jgi:hypothetical protein
VKFYQVSEMACSAPIWMMPAIICQPEIKLLTIQINGATIDKTKDQKWMSMVSKYIISVLVAMLGFLLTGCDAGFPPSNSTNHLEAEEEHIYTEPLFSRWSGAEFPRIISEEGWELVIYGRMVGPDATILLYSLSGNSAEKLLSDIDFSIRDDLGQTYQLLEMLPLAELGKIETGC